MTRQRSLSPQALALLTVLLNDPTEWRHGYELSKETGLKSGTLYPLLMRLSEQGLLEADWREPEQAGRPPRHVYRLTPNGLELAREALASTSPRRRSKLLQRFAEVTP